MSKEQTKTFTKATNADFDGDETSIMLMRNLSTGPSEPPASMKPSSPPASAGKLDLFSTFPNSIDAPAADGAGAVQSAARQGVGRPWSAGMTEGVPVPTAEQTAAKQADMFAKMVDAHKIHSMSRVNNLLKSFPELRPLADSMINRWTAIRLKAMQIAVASLQDPGNVPKRDEFYRHIASTHLPCIELVVALRAHLLPNRSISKQEALNIAIQTQVRTPTSVMAKDEEKAEGAAAAAAAAARLDEQVLNAVADQLMMDAEVLTDIAKGVGVAASNEAELDDSKKVPLPLSDRIDHGWWAVRMLDGGQRLVLVEIAVFKDITKPCTVCGQGKCSARCGRCNTTFYCSSDCQTKHWTLTHNQQCKPDTRPHSMNSVLSSLKTFSRLSLPVLHP